MHEDGKQQAPRYFSVKDHGGTPMKAADRQPARYSGDKHRRIQMILESVPLG